MLPSIFGENLFDDLFSDPFGMIAPVHGTDPLYGKHARNLMKTDVRELENSYELDVDLHWLQHFLLEVTRHLFEEGIAPRTCFNLNAPVGEIEGIRWTRQCMGHWQNELAPLQGERPEDVLQAWQLAGEFVNDEPAATDTDIWAMDHQLLAITPLKLDWTDYGSL